MSGWEFAGMMLLFWMTGLGAARGIETRNSATIHTTVFASFCCLYVIARFTQ